MLQVGNDYSEGIAGSGVVVVFGECTSQKRPDQPPPSLLSFAVDSSDIFGEPVCGDHDDICLTAPGCGEDSAVGDAIGQLG